MEGGEAGALFGVRVFCCIFKEHVMSSDGVSRREWRTVEGVSRGVVAAAAMSLKMIHEEVQLSLGRDGWWARFSAPAECGGGGQVHVGAARRGAVFLV